MELHNLFLSPDPSNVDLALQLLTTMNCVDAFEELMKTYEEGTVGKRKRYYQASSKARFTIVHKEGRSRRAFVITVSEDRWIWVMFERDRFSYVCFTHDKNAYKGLNPHLSVYTRWHLTGFIEELTNYINYEPT